jgi:coproporphyrinogen III oxidase-like Fe-S oxidoreductase
MDAPTARAEGLILGLRLADGIEETTADEPRYADAWAWGLRTGLLASELGRLRLTARGRLLSNELFERLLPASASAPSTATTPTAPAAAA